MTRSVCQFIFSSMVSLPESLNEDQQLSVPALLSFECCRNMQVGIFCWRVFWGLKRLSFCQTFFEIWFVVALLNFDFDCWFIKLVNDILWWKATVCINFCVFLWVAICVFFCRRHFNIGDGDWTEVGCKSQPGEYMRHTHARRVVLLILYYIF